MRRRKTDEISYAVELWDWEGPPPYGWTQTQIHGTSEEALKAAANALERSGGRWRVVRVRKSLMREFP